MSTLKKFVAFMLAMTVMITSGMFMDSADVQAAEKKAPKMRIRVTGRAEDEGEDCVNVRISFKPEKGKKYSLEGGFIYCDPEHNKCFSDKTTWFYSGKCNYYCGWSYDELAWTGKKGEKEMGCSDEKYSTFKVKKAKNGRYVIYLVCGGDVVGTTCGFRLRELVGISADDDTDLDPDDPRIGQGWTSWILSGVERIQTYYIPDFRIEDYSVEEQRILTPEMQWKQNWRSEEWVEGWEKTFKETF